MPDQSPNGATPPEQPDAVVALQLVKWNARVVDQGRDEHGRPVKALLVQSLDQAVQVTVPGIGVDAAKHLAGALLEPPSGLIVPSGGIIIPPA